MCFLPVILVSFAIGYSATLQCMDESSLKSPKNTLNSSEWTLCDNPEIGRAIKSTPQPPKAVPSLVVTTSENPTTFSALLENLQLSPKSKQALSDTFLLKQDAHVDIHYELRILRTALARKSQQIEGHRNELSRKEETIATLTTNGDNVAQELAHEKQKSRRHKILMTSAFGLGSTVVAGAFAFLMNNCK